MKVKNIKKNQNKYSFKENSKMKMKTDMKKKKNRNKRSKKNQILNPKLSYNLYEFVLNFIKILLKFMSSIVS